MFDQRGPRKASGDAIPTESANDERLAADLGDEGLERFRGQIRSEVLVVLFDYWRKLDRASSLPAPFRLRFRLAGTAVVDNRTGLTPRDPICWYLGEAEFREGLARPLHIYGSTTALGCPGYQRLAYASDHPRSTGIYHRLALPLSADGKRVSRLLAGFSGDA